ncbi:MAG: hypothetical protein ACJAWS_003240, partial [Oleiphilaceae bacterium]
QGLVCAFSGKVEEKSNFSVDWLLVLLHYLGEVVK